MTGRIALNKAIAATKTLTGPLRQLSLATVLCAAGSNALSLGLGELSHSSSLGQPLAARISLISPEKDYTPNELKVKHLDAEQASHMGVELLSYFQRFEIEPVLKNGQLYIELSSDDPVTEPFINLLIELKWPTGQVYREYTLLLDPPNVQLSQSMLPAQTTTTSATTAAAAKPQSSVASSPRQARQVPATRPLAEGDYRVRSGDSLSKIAQRYASGTAYDYRDVMNWLLVNNQHAFIKGDPNRLKAAVVLTLPSEATWSKVEAPQRQIEQPKPSAQSAAPKPVAAAPAKQPQQAPVAEPQERFADPVVNEPRLTLKTSSLEDQQQKSVAQRNQEQLEERLRLTKEQNDRLLRENKAIEARLKRLEGSDYIRSLERLVQLRDQEIAELKAIASQQAPGASDGGENTQASQEQALVKVDSKLGAVESNQEAEPQAEEQGEVNNRLLLWVLLISAAIGSAYFYFSGRRPAKELDFEKADFDEDAELAKLDEALADQDESIGFDPSEQDLSFSSLFDDQGQPTGADHVGKWRPDPALSKKIKEKTKEYVPESPKGFTVVHHHEHDNLDDLISDALAYCAQGYYDRAESMLIAEEQTRGTESRIQTALDYIRNLREQAE